MKSPFAKYLSRKPYRTRRGTLLFPPVCARIPSSYARLNGPLFPVLLAGISSPADGDKCDRKSWDGHASARIAIPVAFPPCMVDIRLAP